MWLPWAEVSATAALDRYAQQYASTRFLLSGTAQEQLNIRAGLAAEDLTSTQEPIPVAGSSLFVSCFAFPAATACLVEQYPGQELVLNAEMQRITRKRAHLYFPALGTEVAWSLINMKAFCSMDIMGRTIIDAAFMDTLPELRTALGARTPAQPGMIASTIIPAVTPSRPVPPVILQAKLRDGAWHDIIVENDTGRTIDAFVPDLDVHINVSRSLTRAKQG
jgi:hypothetical protein